MADVPAWTLIANSLVAGGFGLAGTFLMPKAQRETLKQERERADAAIMRDKAEAIFREIAALDVEAAKVAKNTFAVIHGAPAPHMGAEIKGLDALRAVVAVYYPGALPIIDEHDTRLREVTTPFAARLKEANETPIEGRSAAINAVSHELVTTIWAVLEPALKDIRAFVIDAVQPYVPVEPD